MAKRASSGLPRRIRSGVAVRNKKTGKTQLIAKTKYNSRSRLYSLLGDYYTSHMRNVKRQRPISFRRFEEGLLVKMDYFGKTTGRYKTAFYLIITANYQNYAHVFDIDFVPVSVLKFLITLTKNKMLEDFFFGNSTYPYYNFGGQGNTRALYRKLLPIMGKSYRKLILNSNNIRRTYILDYDFGKIKTAIKPKFIYPDIKDEALALEDAAIEYDLSKRNMLKSAQNGKLITLTPAVWSKIQNTDSWQIGITLDQVKQYASIRGKSPDTTNRIIAGMKSSQTFYAPIILKYDDEFYCIAGNTRLMTAMALRVVPKVYIFEYSTNVSRKNR